MHRTDASWKLHAPAFLSQYLLYMRLGGLQRRSGRFGVKNLWLVTGLEPRNGEPIVQPPY